MILTRTALLLQIAPPSEEFRLDAALWGGGPEKGAISLVEAMFHLEPPAFNLLDRVSG